MNEAGGFPPIPEMLFASGVHAEPRRRDSVAYGERCTGPVCGGVILTAENGHKNRRCKSCRRDYLERKRAEPGHAERQKEYGKKWRESPKGQAWYANRRKS